MRRARWACFATSLVLAGCLATPATPPADAVVEWREVEVQAAELPPDAWARDARPDPGGPWRRATLPVVEAGAAMLPRGGGTHVHWIRVRYCPPPGSQGTGLFVPRPGIAYLSARFNGVVVEDAHWNAGPRWNTPALFVAPPGTLRPGADNEIVLALQTRGGPVRVSGLEVGPYPGALQARYEARLFAVEAVPRIVTVLLLAFGLFVFAVWWRRRTETAYLAFSLSMLAWSLYLMPYHYLASVGSPWTLTIRTLAAASLPWVVTSTSTFLLRTFGIASRRTVRLLIGYAAVTSLLTLVANELGRGVQIVIWALTVNLLPACVTALVLAVGTRSAFRLRTPEAASVVIALWVQLVFGLHDGLQALGLVSLGTIPLVPLSAPLTLAAFGYAVLRRYVASLSAVERSNLELAERLEQRTRELSASHERLREVEREQALAEERQRLMREMHDGMGSALMSTLVLVEQGRLDSAEVAQVLRESIDELKLTIDSLEPIGQDLLTLLATLRYRLGARLERAGLAIDWQVRDLPALAWLDSAAALQVLRILQEALTNVIKHAGASRIRIDTAVEGQEVVVRVSDDGSGFDADAAPAEGRGGRGLQNMRRRAAALGGRLALRSRAGATELSLHLPLERSSTP